MKLSKKVWLIVVIVIFAIVLGVLFSIYAGQAAERGELQNRLDDDEDDKQALNITLDDLKDDLASAESELKKYRAEFPESVESIEYGEDLFEIADDCNVDLTSLSPSAPTSKKVGAVTYSVSSFALVVKGNIDDILDFIYAIRTGEGFDLPDFPWSADLKGVNIDGSQASMTLDIYSYKG